MADEDGLRDPRQTRGECAAQGRVQGADRPFALGRRTGFPGAALGRTAAVRARRGAGGARRLFHPQPHARLEGDAVVRGAALDDLVGQGREGLGVPSRSVRARGRVGQFLVQEQFERRVGGLEGPAVGLQSLDAGDGAGDGLGVLDGEAELKTLQLQAGAPGHLRHQDAGRVADDVRVDVLIEPGVDLHRAGVQTRLVREGGGAHIGLVAVGADVGGRGHGVGRPGEFGQSLRRQHGQVQLGGEVPDDREQVRVARAFAVAVAGALDVGGAGLDGRDRVGHGASGVVLAVDADPESGALDDLGDGVGETAGELASVGVAEHGDVGARRHGRVQDAQRGVGVVGVPVEEVLAVEEHPAPLGPEEADGVPDHRAVLRHVRAQRALDVSSVGLGDQGDHRGVRLQQRADLRVLVRSAARLARAAEGDQRRVPQVEFGGGTREEGGVLGQGAGPAAFDEADAERVQ